MSATPHQRRRIEIIHESLLAKWPRLVRWQTEDTHGAQFRDALRQAATTWDQRGRSPDFLWSGSAYREYLVWRERYPAGLSELEQTFVTAMTAAVQRLRRRRMAALVAAFVILSALLAGMTLARRESELARRRAEAEARRAEAARLLALAQLELQSYPTAALAFATRSLELADTAEARQFAIKALWRGPAAFIMPLPPQSQWWTVAFSPDDRWLAIGSFDSEVLVYGSKGGTPIVLRGHEPMGAPRLLAFDPTSRYLITSSAGPGGATPLRVWSIPDGKLIRRIEIGRRYYFDQAGDGICLFVRGDDGRIVLQRTSILDGPLLDVARIHGVGDIDSAGRWIAESNDQKVVMRSLNGKSERDRFIGSHASPITRLLFGTNDRLLSEDATSRVKIWSTATQPALLREYAPLSGMMIWDGSGRRLLAEDNMDRSARVWELALPQEVEPLILRRGVSNLIKQLTTTTRGDWLVMAQQTDLSLWPLTTRAPRIIRAHEGRIVQIDFSPDGDWVVTGSYDTTVRLWHLNADPARKSHLVTDERGMNYGLAVSPTGNQLLIAFTGLRAFLGRTDQSERTTQLHPPVGAPRGAAFDRSGQYAALGSHFSANQDDRVIRIWDAATGKVLTELDLLEGRRGAQVDGPYDGGVIDLEFAPDGTLFSAGEGGIRRWDVARRSAEVVVAAPWMRMDLAAGGNALLTLTRPNWGSAEGGEVHYHQLDTKRSRPLPHGSTVSSVALDPSGTIAVTGSADGTIRVGRVTGEEPHLLLGHEGEVAALDVSPDGRWIASGGQDGFLRIWSMPDLSKQPLHTLPHEELLAKLKSLTNLRVLADGRGYRLDVGPFPGWEKVPEW